MGRININPRLNYKDTCDMYVINSRQRGYIPSGFNLQLNEGNVFANENGGVTQWGTFTPSYSTLPTLLSNELNGHNVVYFANTQDALEANLNIFSYSNTICVVCKLFGGVEQPTAPVFAQGRQVDGIYSNGYGVIGFPSSYDYLVRKANVRSSASIPFSHPAWAVVIGKRDNAINTSYINVNGMKSQNTQVVDFNDQYNGWRIAKGAPDNTNSHVQIAEIIHYPRALDKNEENSLMLYMRSKYNI